MHSLHHADAGIEREIFEKDWVRVNQKGRFMKILNKLCPEPDQLQDLRLLLKERYDALVPIFDYYASIGAGDPFAMHMGAWGMLVQDASIAGALFSVIPRSGRLP